LANHRFVIRTFGKLPDNLDVEDSYRGIKDIDMVPNLSPKNLVAVEIGKDFMLSHGYIKNDFDVSRWAAPLGSGERLG
jgi:hypothetical protein